MSREIPPGTPAPSERPCERAGDVVDFGGQRVAAGPCVDRDGHRVAHTEYVFPARRNPILRASVLVGLALSAFLVTAFFVSARTAPAGTDWPLRTTLSPGPTSAAHTLGKFDCAQCHRQAHNVESERCERCHDPVITGRLSNAAHVFQGTARAIQAFDAPEVACATCHIEHRGTMATLTEIDDRECGTCHRTNRAQGPRLTTFAAHPEFAIVKAGTEVGGGLRWFSHEKHLDKVFDKFQKRCEACHERSTDTAPSFKPIVFAERCAVCHEKDLEPSAGALKPEVIAALGPLPSNFKVSEDFDNPTLRSITGIKHADPWLLRTVQRLRSVSDPDGFAADRATLDREVAQLELMTMFPLASGRAAGWVGLDKNLPMYFDGVWPTTSRSPDDAIRESTPVAESFAKSLEQQGASAPAGANPAAPIKPASPSPASSGAASAQASVRQLGQLLDATIDRARAAGSQNVVDRANALKARLSALELPTSASAAAAANDNIPPFLRELRNVADPGVRAEIARIERLFQIARTNNAGIDAISFDQQRQRTLYLLNAVLQETPQPEGGDRSIHVRGENIRARANALQRDLLANSFGMPTEINRARERFFGERQSARARIETELEAAGLRDLTSNRAIEDPSWDRELDQRRRRLNAIGSATPLSVPMSPDDARAAIAALLGTEARDAEGNQGPKNRCTLCHELTPAGDQLAPVRMAGGSLLVNATFTHRAHVKSDTDRDTCVTCHTDITKSAAARDLNIPGVDSCRSCHAPAKQAANWSGCESCHKYHVPPAAAFAWRP